MHTELVIKLEGEKYLGDTGVDGRILLCSSPHPPVTSFLLCAHILNSIPLSHIACLLSLGEETEFHIHT